MGPTKPLKSRYSSTAVNPKYYQSIGISGLTGSKSGIDPGYVWAPYVISQASLYYKRVYVNLANEKLKI